MIEIASSRQFIQASLDFFERERWEMNREERRQRRRDDTRKARILIATLALGVVLLVAGAAILAGTFLLKNGGGEPVAGSERPDTQEAMPTEAVEAQQTEETQEPQAPEIDQTVQQAAEIVGGMSLEDKVAQMFIITPNALTGYSSGVTAAAETTKQSYQSRPVGGLLYTADNLKDPDQTREMLSSMQQISDERTGLPIFLCAEEEGGGDDLIAGNGAFGIEGADAMASVGQTGDPQNAYDAGKSIGTYLADLGFNVNLGPVADVLSNPDNAALAERSFGSDAGLVSEMASSALQGLSDAGIYGVVKHFPGYGGTSGDGSEGAVSVDKSKEEMAASDFAPFQSAIDAGASFIMVGHASAPGVTGDSTPSSLSKAMVTDVLRTEMGFDGIIVTDGMNLPAITAQFNSDNAAVLAVEAGVDMILTPADYGKAYDAVLSAVQDGTITEARINESLLRIVQAKLKMQQ